MTNIITPEGLELVKYFEGLRQKAYRCPAGVWTIGYGHTKGVKPGDVCLKKEAEEWLEQDLQEAETCVRKRVRVPLNDNQYSALCSFVFNFGCGAFHNSTLLKKLNLGDYLGAANEFERWVYADGKRLNGLTRRREAERRLFMKGMKA